MLPNHRGSASGHKDHGHSHGRSASSHEDHGHSHGRSASSHEDHGHSHGRSASSHEDHGHNHGGSHGHSHGIIGARLSQPLQHTAIPAHSHGHSHGGGHGHSHGHIDDEPADCVTKTSGFFRGSTNFLVGWYGISRLLDATVVLCASWASAELSGAFSPEQGWQGFSNFNLVLGGFVSLLLNSCDSIIHYVQDSQDQGSVAKPSTPQATSVAYSINSQPCPLTDGHAVAIVDASAPVSSKPNALSCSAKFYIYGALGADIYSIAGNLTGLGYRYLPPNGFRFAALVGAFLLGWAGSLAEYKTHTQSQLKAEGKSPSPSHQDQQGEEQFEEANAVSKGSNGALAFANFIAATIWITDVVSAVAVLAGAPLVTPLAIGCAWGGSALFSLALTGCGYSVALEQDRQNQSEHNVRLAKATPVGNLSLAERRQKKLYGSFALGSFSIAGGLASIASDLAPAPAKALASVVGLFAALPLGIAASYSENRRFRQYQLRAQQREKETVHTSLVGAARP